MTHLLCLLKENDIGSFKIGLLVVLMADLISESKM